ncbi:hypothetical protein [Streptomyces sp. NPDC058572]|uniref:hypothetical protein n=1 Tax=Streptomyces sp. NPDC058572 TaxID=3346546 RepID=UPI00364B29D7
MATTHHSVATLAAAGLRAPVLLLRRDGCGGGAQGPGTDGPAAGLDGPAPDLGGGVSCTSGTGPPPDRITPPRLCGGTTRCLVGALLSMISSAA